METEGLYIYTYGKYLQEWVCVRVVFNSRCTWIISNKNYGVLCQLWLLQVLSKCYELKKIPNMWMSQFWLYEVQNYL